MVLSHNIHSALALIPVNNMPMVSQQRLSKNCGSSFKYWWIPLEVKSSKPDLTVLNENLCTPSTSHPKNGLLSDRSFSKGLTVSHFRSAASGIWDIVGQPANILTKGNCQNDNLYEKFVLFQLESERDASTLHAKFYPKDAEFKTSATAKSNFENLIRIKKMLLFASCSSNRFNFYSTASSNKDSNIAFKGARAMARNASKIILNPFFYLKDITKFTKRGFYKIDEGFSIAKVPSNQPGIQIPESFGGVEDTDLLTKNRDSSKCEQKSPNSLFSARTFHSSTCSKEAMTIFRQPPSELQTSLDLSLTLKSEACQKLLNCTSVISESKEVASATNYQNTCENDKFFSSVSLLEDFSPNSWMAIQKNLQHAFSNNRHAIAGALAGTLVTICLHPVDTVKTIIQANQTGQKSFYYILRRIVSHHGICGLYRGIASNITSSAPISAIYTFTYEYAKCTLLPLLPKEYHSFAHCIAGGCSSLATSFVFTPSERIKQQMQVSTQYQNSWKALIGCLQYGGLSSLYAGWGAVLCRNIPHSIIKFYTYESLKQFISSAYPNSNLKTFHTLVCGGLAGSTAALFTTPFDVVKTRLQTQPPGSIGRYHGVFHALQEIARQEGLQGLYRGLTPRLAMYVSQGAIFFASYEFLKSVLFLETQENATIKENEVCCDDPSITGLQKLPA